MIESSNDVVQKKVLSYSFKEFEARIATAQAVMSVLNSNDNISLS